MTSPLRNGCKYSTSIIRVSRQQHFESSWYNFSEILPSLLRHQWFWHRFHPDVTLHKADIGVLFLQQQWRNGAQRSSKTWELKCSASSMVSRFPSNVPSAFACTVTAHITLWLEFVIHNHAMSIGPKESRIRALRLQCFLIMFRKRRSRSALSKHWWQQEITAGMTSGASTVRVMNVCYGWAVTNHCIISSTGLLAQSALDSTGASMMWMLSKYLCIGSANGFTMALPRWK